MSFFKKKEFFTPEEKQLIITAIQQAEQRTSGEVRVFVERHCRYVNAIDRAIEIFQQLKMDQTEFHNAVLVYVATKDRQLVRWPSFAAQPGRLAARRSTGSVPSSRRGWSGHTSRDDPGRARVAVGGAGPPGPDGGQARPRTT